MKHPWITFLFAAVILTHCDTTRADNRVLFGETPPAEYLTGRFTPSAHPLFVDAGAAGIPSNGRQYLRKETVQALKNMYQELIKSVPGASFRIASSTRNFFDQKGIWENKWNGRMLVEGKSLNKSHPDPMQRALKILEYSSMPGTSRHHWGTDFDINELNNSYYINGAGAAMYRWMQANAARYGFCQPYSAGRTAGYQEEKWHWSYRPLSAQLLQQWEAMHKDNPGWMVTPGLFAGNETAGRLAEIYVQTVNPDCN